MIGRCSHPTAWVGIVVFALASAALFSLESSLAAPRLVTSQQQQQQQEFPQISAKLDALSNQVQELRQMLAEHDARTTAATSVVPQQAAVPTLAIAEPAAALVPTPALRPSVAWPSPQLATRPSAARAPPVAAPAPVPVVVRVPPLVPQQWSSQAGGADACAGKRHATNVGVKCYSQIWHEVGCTGPPQQYEKWTKQLTYDALVSDSRGWANNYDYRHLAGCRAGFSRGADWPELHSQVGQDLWVLTHFSAPGFYLDVGAHHGNYMSNTRALQDLGWRGICVEPRPKDRFKERNCALESSAIVPVAPQSGTVSFQNCEDGTGTSGHSRLATISESSGGCSLISVRAITWEELIRRHSSVLPADGIIQTLSLDCEGCELSLINAFPFHRLCVETWVLENGPVFNTGVPNPNHRKLREAMAAKGCRLETVLGMDQDDGYVCDCTGFKPRAA